tara:strand:+ start:913 stop:1017 length:105 start_codon:yes stop_codon:yes gene_type:complete
MAKVVTARVTQSAGGAPAMKQWPTAESIKKYYPS